MTMVAVEVKATWETIADQPDKGGRGLRKKRKTRLKKRSRAERLPSSSLGEVGGKHERFFCRVAIPGNDRDG